jgi:L-asparaginase
MRRVDVLAMGGTIASVAGGTGPGVSPSLTAGDLLAAVPALARAADVRGCSFRQFPSSELVLSDLFALAAEIRRRAGEGAEGIVVTQGTDTLEETAFALDLLCEPGIPVAVTGAMRNPGMPGADGPANLLAAVQVAASTQARGLGVTVVFNDEIHAARFVRKTHTSNTATFRSPLTGPLGWISEGRVSIAARPAEYPRVPVPADARPAAVALVKLVLGDDMGGITHVAQGSYDGLVVEAYGGGHVPARFAGPLAALAARIPVVLASRTGAGEMLRQTYGFPGGEMDLLGRGLISAGALDGLKARLLLALLLTSGNASIADSFAAIGFGGAAPGP